MYLLTDGLPTRGKSWFKRAKVTAAQRQEFFEEAAAGVRGPAHHVILLPLEGDPERGRAVLALRHAHRRAVPGAGGGLAVRRRRRGSDNNLSFLDVVSCGFGAIVLLILITKPADGPPAEDFSRLLEWLRGQLAAAVERRDEAQGEERAARERVERERARLAAERAAAGGGAPGAGPRRGRTRGRRRRSRAGSRPRCRA